MALQCVVTDHRIASVQTREPIVFSYYFKAWNEQNKHQKVFYFKPRNTPFFKYKSTEVNLLFFLICG